MIYKSEFTALNGKSYYISIDTSNGGTSTKTFTLGANPFTVKIKSDGKHIYAPIKASSATITMLTNQCEFDLYTGQAQGSKVKVLDDNSNVVWVGFLTPCLYDMGYDEYFEEIELEAVDGIAVLKEIPYSYVETKNSATFANVIFTCLKKANCYKQFYITDNVQLTASGTESIIERFKISEQNFFDQKKDINQTDDDVAWSAYDVLYEIMQYLGYSLFVDGESVIIADYDAIKRGNNKYFKYSLTGTSLGSPTSTTLKYSYAINGDSYAQSGTTISLDDVYNKVSVKDEFQTYDSVFPELGDSTYETNITAASDSYMRQNTTNSSSGLLWTSDTFQDTDKNGNPNNFQIFVTSAYKGKMFVVIMKFYKNKAFNFLKYSTSSRADITSNYKDYIGYGDMLRNHGAYYIKIWKKEINGNDYNTWRAPYAWDTMSTAERKAAWTKLLNQDPSKITLTPMIVFTNYANGHIGPGGYLTSGSYDLTDREDCRSYPYIALESGQSSSVFGGSNAYLIIKGSIISHDEQGTPWPISDGANNSDLKRAPDYKFNDQFFNWARLKWGDQYWNGLAWTSTPSDFKLWFHKQDGDKTRVKDYYDKEFEVLDTAQADFACSEKGYYVPAPTEGNLDGEAQFLLYCPRDWWGRSNHNKWDSKNKYSRYYNYVQTVKNLGIKAYITNGVLDEKENSSDTVYTNVINNGSISEMGDVKFKICTFDNKKPNYSSVEYTSNGKNVYVCKTINKANRTLESGSVSSYDNQSGLTQEEHLVFKLVTQYEEPRAKFEVNLHNEGHKMYGLYTDASLSGRIFVVSDMETDYKSNCTKIKLIEKA